MEEDAALAHEDEEGSRVFSTLTGVLVGLNGDSFEVGLGVKVVWITIVAVWAEVVVSIRRVGALGTVCHLT